MTDFKKIVKPTRPQLMQLFKDLETVRKFELLFDYIDDIGITNDDLKQLPSSTSMLSQVSQMIKALQAEIRQIPIDAGRYENIEKRITALEQSNSCKHLPGVIKKINEDIKALQQSSL